VHDDISCVVLATFRRAWCHKVTIRYPWSG
jgi:hypothetical protein